MAWQAKMFREGKDPDVIKEDACTVGNLVHLYIEQHIKGEPIPSEELNRYSMDDIVIAEQGLESFKVFEQDNGVQWLHTEIPLVHEELRYGGCIDIVGMFNGVLTLADNKTSKGIWAEQLIQVAAYAELWNNTHEDKIQSVCIVHISKEPKENDKIITPYTVDMSILEGCFDVFKELLKLHNKNKEISKYLNQLTKG